MNNNEKIQKAEQLIAEANALLNEVKANSSNEKDVLTKYKDDYDKDKHYYIDWNGDIDWVPVSEIASEMDAFEERLNPCSNYLTEELAKQAKKIKDFNDKLLAFKYCYDLDYKPDWSDKTKKYYVYYNAYDNEYMADGLCSMREPLVYFSTKEIAQKCADWLNSLSE